VYENGNMRPDETTPGIGGRIKENGEGSEFSYKIL
jgi:hypothetical protein